MNVKELIKYLENCNQNAEVKVTAPFHNGYKNSPVIEKPVDIEEDRLADRIDYVEIEIADYQI